MAMRQRQLDLNVTQLLKDPNLFLIKFLTYDSES